MADVHNHIKYYGVLADAVAIATGLDRSSASGLERTSETLSVNFNPWERAEWSYLRGERIFSFSRNIAAVAAEFGMAGLINPAGSGMIVVVEKVTAGGSNLTFQLDIELNSFITGTLTQSGSLASLRDTRWNPANQGPQIWTGTDPALQTNIFETRNSDGTGLTQEFTSPPYVLSPNVARGLLLQGATVNTAFNVCFAGYFRPALPGELT